MSSVRGAKQHSELYVVEIQMTYSAINLLFKTVFKIPSPFFPLRNGRANYFTVKDYPNTTQNFPSNCYNNLEMFA